MNDYVSDVLYFQLLTHTLANTTSNDPDTNPDPTSLLFPTTTMVKVKSNGSSLVGNYTAAGGDSYAGGPQRGSSNYGTQQSYHPYRR
ncbi:hypothetical protein FQR65_LT11357 [Abscondita terminalis]|nr:hypothetical protein FQR65_LT11357 [Abscondita terminalis]